MRSQWIGLVLLTGCPENKLASIDDDHGQYDGQLEADPGAVLFGNVDAGQSVTEVVTITSIGTASVTLLGAAIVGDGSFTMTWGYSGTVLDPTDSIDVAITYDPETLDDDAQLIVSSNAVDDELIVPLSGALSAPAIAISPSPALFEADDNGLPVTGELLIENVGTAPLSLDDAALIDNGNFTILSSPIPTLLDVGDIASMMVEYTPDNEPSDDTGELWVTSNAPSSPTLVPLIGTRLPPCLGLAEAWGRGMLDIYSPYGSSITLENISDEYDICIDRWYVYMGTETQDAIGGDPLYDPGAEYPLGTITLPPGEQTQLRYSESDIPAWWCVEETQVTNTSYNFLFTGARAPTPLLDRGLGANDQDAIWLYQSTNPAVAIGRNAHYAALVRSSPTERSTTAIINVINLGEVDVDTIVYETVPNGFSATDFSVEHDSETENSDGSITYGFAVHLNARIPTESRDEHTDYDELDISYTLTLDDTDACVGRMNTVSPSAVWTDTDGDTYTSTGSPMVLECY